MYFLVNQVKKYTIVDIVPLIDTNIGNLDISFLLKSTIFVKFIHFSSEQQENAEYFGEYLMSFYVGKYMDRRKDLR